MFLKWGKYRGWQLAKVPGSYLVAKLESGDLDTVEEQQVVAELTRRLYGAGRPIFTTDGLREKLAVWFGKVTAQIASGQAGSGDVVSVVNAARDELLKTLGL